MIFNIISLNFLYFLGGVMKNETEVRHKILFIKNCIKMCEVAEKKEKS
jgi:hypothetical protein